jgi:hypothetical protein
MAMIDRRSLLLAAASAVIPAPALALEEPSRTARGAALHRVTTLDTDAINQRYFRDRADGLKVTGASGRILDARL